MGYSYFLSGSNIELKKKKNKDIGSGINRTITYPESQKQAMTMISDTVKESR